MDDIDALIAEMDPNDPGYKNAMDEINSLIAEVEGGAPSADAPAAAQQPEHVVVEESEEVTLERKKRSQRQDAMAGLMGTREPTVGYTDQKAERIARPTKDAVAQVKARLLAMQQQGATSQQTEKPSKQRAAEISVDLKSKTAAFAKKDEAPPPMPEKREKKEHKHRHKTKEVPAEGADAKEKKEKKHREKKSLAELIAKDNIKGYSPTFFDNEMVSDLQKKEGYTLDQALRGLYETFRSKQSTNDYGVVVVKMRELFGTPSKKVI